MTITKSSQGSKSSQPAKGSAVKPVQQTSSILKPAKPSKVSQPAKGSGFLSPADLGSQTSSMINNAGTLAGGMQLLINSLEHMHCLGKGIAASLKLARVKFEDCEQIQMARKTWDNATKETKKSFTNAWDNALRAMGKKEKRAGSGIKPAMVLALLLKMDDSSFDNAEDKETFRIAVMAHMETLEPVSKPAKRKGSK